MIDYKQLIQDQDDFNNKKTLTLVEFKAWLVGYLQGRDPERLTIDDMSNIVEQVVKLHEATPAWTWTAPWTTPPTPVAPHNRPGDTTHPDPLNVWYGNKFTTDNTNDNTPSIFTGDILYGRQENNT